MSMCDFVLIRLTDFELYAKTQIFYKISRQIRPLTPTGKGHLLEYLKNTFTILFVGSIHLAVPHRVCLIQTTSQKVILG